MDMINYVVRPQLIRLLEWEIGFKTNFSVSVGKSSKYIWKWLKKEKWSMFLETYSNSNIKDIWKAVFIMCDLFDNTAKKISNIMNIEYNEIEAINSLKFLKDVYKLPKDVKEIY
jgi:aminoglycoside 6-adenylyltransferase